ncbi:MAG TPA: DinB family protein [Gemmatimonadaceae bacterium]
MNESVAQCRHLVSLADAMLAGLDDSHLALEPEPGAKTAGWLLGHLAITGDFARHLCGRPPICPAEWRLAFRDGSEPSRDPSTYPRMAELCAAFWGVYRDLPLAAANADADADAAAAKLAGPNPYAPVRGSFPLASDFVAYIISGHLGYHLGQLVAWRAAAGLGRLQRTRVSENTPEARQRSVS